MSTKGAQCATVAAEDDEVVFTLPKANADEFCDDEITFNVSPRKRVHKRALVDVSNSPAASKKGTKPATRSFFWDKCTGSPPTFWKASKNVELAPEQRAALAVNFAKSEPVAPKRLRGLTASSGTQHAGTVAAGRSKAAPSPSVLSIERRRQIGIILARLKTTAEELCAALERLAPQDVDALQGERLGMILELAPTVDEVRALQAFEQRGNAAALDSADKTLAALMGVPKCMLRLRALECFHTFDAAGNEISQLAEALCVGCNEVLGSDTLKSTLKTILAAGNCLNEGSTHGGASGFKLQSLAKLGHMKTHDGTRTMLDVVLELVRNDAGTDQNFADVLQTELAGLPMASKCSFSSMCVDHASHGRRLETMRDEISASPDSAFANAFASFVERAHASLAEHSAVVQRTGVKLRHMLCHFGEGESTKGTIVEEFAIIPSAQTTALSDGATAFFCTLGAFLDEISAAEAKHQRRARSERERATRLQRAQKQTTATSANDSNGTKAAADAPNAVAEMVRMANEKRMRFDAMRCSSAPVDSPRTMRVKQLKMKQQQTVKVLSQETKTGVAAPKSSTESGSAVPTLATDSAVAVVYEESAPPADAIAKMEQRIAFHEKRSAELENELKLQRKAATDALARAAQSEQQLKKASKQDPVEGSNEDMLVQSEAAAATKAELEDAHKQLEAQAERIAKLEKVKMTNGHIKYVAKLKKERGALEKDAKALRKELSEVKCRVKHAGDTETTTAPAPAPAPALELKAKCEKLEHELEKMRDEVAELQHELAAARADTGAAAKLEEIARARCSKLEAKLQAVRSKGNAAERSFTEAESSFSSAIDEKSSQIEQQCARITELESSLSTAREQCKESDLRVNELTKQLHHGADELAQAQDKCAEAIRSKSVAEERNGHLQAETKVLQAEVQQTQCALAKAKETELTLREELSVVEKRCDETGSARDALQVELTQAEEMLSARSEEAEARAKCIEKLQGEVTEARARCATATIELNTAQQQSSDKASELEQLQADHELHAKSQAARISTLDSELDSMRMQVETAQQSACAAREQLSSSAEDTAVALAATQAELETFRQNAQSAKKSADDSAATCEKLRVELQHARASDTENQGELEDCRKKSREELDALQAQLEEKVSMLESAQADLTATTLRANQSEAHALDVEKARALVDDELVSVRSELEQIQHHVRSLEAELEKLRKVPASAATEATEAAGEATTEAAAEEEAEQQLLDADNSYDPDDEEVQPELPQPSRRSRRTARLSLRLSGAPDDLEDLIDGETEPEEEDKPQQRSRRSARLSVRLSGAPDLADLIDDEPEQDKPEPAEEDKPQEPTPAKGKKKRRKLRGKKSLCPGAFADVKQMLDSEEVEIVFLGKGKGYRCSGCGTKLPSKSAAEMHKKSCDSF